MRQITYWFLIFPEGVCLDNQIFSSDEITVEPAYNPMTVESVDSNVGKQLFGMAVHWTVAELGGRRIELGKAKPDAKTLFA